MIYIRVQVSTTEDELLYQKDIDVSLLRPIEQMILSQLRFHGIVGIQERYSVSIFPHYEKEMRYSDPVIGKLSKQQQSEDMVSHISLGIDPDDHKSDVPFKFLSVTLFTRSGLGYFWEIKAQDLKFIDRIFYEILYASGYIEEDQKIKCTCFVRNDDNYEQEEKIFAKAGKQGINILSRGTPLDRLKKGATSDFSGIKVWGSPSKEQMPLIFIDANILAEIFSQAQTASEKHEEMGGLLVGRPLLDKDTNTLFIDIVGIVKADAPASIDRVFFTEQVIERLDTEMKSAYPDMIKLGWYHSHPPVPKNNTDSAYDNVFFSIMDMNVNKQFREDWHVALVVNGLGTNGKFYRWKKMESRNIVEFSGFYSYQTKEGSR